MVRTENSIYGAKGSSTATHKVQKHVSYTGSHKRFLIYYGICLEKAGFVFSIVFHSFFLLY